MITYRNTSYHNGIYHKFRFEMPADVWAVEVEFDGERVLLHKPLPVDADADTLCSRLLAQYGITEKVCEAPHPSFPAHTPDEVRELTFGDQFRLIAPKTYEYRKANPVLKCFIETI